ncbi:MAG: GTPase [Victivallis sp.]
MTHSCVIDREEVILDIFAERASTREAVLQVELARTRYSLPRLTRAWTHLSRQHGGGATTRGEGEAQIETDRRLLRRRIRQLEEELKTVRKQRETQRKSRRRNLVPHGAIVGYTNVGKSSLLQALSGSELLVKDQLFATLDPTTRRVPLGRISRCC